MNAKQRRAKNRKAAGVGTEATLGTTQQANHSAMDTASKEPDVLNSKSTSTEVQLQKAIALLRQGPKTTIELREHGIMMPAARIGLPRVR